MSRDEACFRLLPHAYHGAQGLKSSIERRLHAGQVLAIGKVDVARIDTDAADAHKRLPAAQGARHRRLANLGRLAKVGRQTRDDHLAKVRG